MSTALATVPTSPSSLALAGGHLTRDQVDLIKRTIAKGATDDELALFVATANRMGLDPFARQIFAVKRRTRVDDQWVDVMAIQVSIDGYRLNAARTGEYDGQDGPFWCGEDGVWRDVWLDTKKPPVAAKVVVYRKGITRGFVGVAAYASYVQTNRDGKANAMWSRGPDFMLAKCSEAVALRKAFPNELGGTTTPEEVGNEDEKPATFAAIPTGAPAALPTAASATPPAATPSKPAEPAKPPMTDAEFDALVAEIKGAQTVKALRVIAVDKIRPANKTEAQAGLLRKFYEDQLDLIETAAAVEDGAQP